MIVSFTKQTLHSGLQLIYPAKGNANEDAFFQMMRFLMDLVFSWENVNAKIDFVKIKIVFVAILIE
jgi:hypothetical protein